MSEENERPKVRSRSNSRVRLMKSTNPFINFVHVFRKDSAAVGKEVLKAAGAKWKAMSEEDKAPYIEAAAKVKKLKENDPNPKPKKKKKSKKTSKKSKEDRDPSRNKGKKASIRPSICSKCGHRHGSIVAEHSKSKHRRHRHRDRLWKSRHNREARDASTNESTNYSEYQTFSSVTSGSF